MQIGGAEKRTAPTLILSTCIGTYLFKRTSVPEINIIGYTKGGLRESSWDSLYIALTHFSAGNWLAELCGKTPWMKSAATRMRLKPIALLSSH